MSKSRRLTSTFFPTILLQLKNLSKTATRWWPQDNIFGRVWKTKTTSKCCWKLDITTPNTSQLWHLKSKYSSTSGNDLINWIISHPAKNRKQWVTVHMIPVLNQLSLFGFRASAINWPTSGMSITSSKATRFTSSPFAANISSIFFSESLYRTWEYSWLGYPEE